MKKIFSIFYLVLFLCGAVYSQNNSASAGFTKDPPGGKDITQDVVEAFCRKLLAELETDQKNYAKQSYLSYSLARNNVNRWLNYQFLELDSDINQSWFKKLNQFIQFFHDTKRSYDKSREVENSEFRVLNKKRFDAGVASFKKFMELKPPKPPPQRLEVLKRQKQEYLRAKKVEERKKNSGGKTRKLFDDEG